MSKESSLHEDAAAAIALETLKSKKVSIRSTWTPDEDKIIKRSLEKVKHSEDMPGEEFTCWAGLTSQLPGRTGRQIRDRWNNYLNPKIIHEPFTRDDDIKLWNAGRELGKKWVEISTTVFKSTRSENQLKNRWNSATWQAAPCSPKCQRCGQRFLTWCQATCTGPGTQTPNMEQQLTTPVTTGQGKWRPCF